MLPAGRAAAQPVDGSTGAKSVVQAPPATCDWRQKVTAEPDGTHRIVLLAGVWDYQAPRITDLLGPRNDLRLMSTLLTDKAFGFQVPASNLCVLSNPTVDGFRTAFREALTKRAAPGDVVLVYFSGHGSGAPDLDHDEGDEVDETWMFADSGTPSVGGLTDDAIGQLVDELSAVTTDITLVLDSCNSGSGARLVMEEEGLSRRVEMHVDDAPGVGPDHGGAGVDPWEKPTAGRGFTLLAASADGTSAFESQIKGGEAGYFTTALVGALGAAHTQPITWAKAHYSLRTTLRQSSRGQSPQFWGDAEKTVLSAREGRAPYAWRVVSSGAMLTLEGVPQPGWGPGATIRLFPGSAATTAPADAVATAEVTAWNGFSATARVIWGDATKVGAGDRAALAMASPEGGRLTFTLQKEGSKAVPTSIVQALQARHRDVWPGNVLDEVDHGAAWVVEGTPGGKLRVRDPEGLIRNDLPSAATGQLAADALLKTLGDHARVRMFMGLSGETGGILQDDQTLSVRLIPEHLQGSDVGKIACSERALTQWAQSPSGAEQLVPACGTFRIEVTNRGSVALYPAAVVLSADGRTLIYQSEQVLQPGVTITLGPRRSPLRGTPPLGPTEWVRVFGTEEPITWPELSTGGKAVAGSAGALERALTNVLAGDKNTDVPSQEPGLWTVSTVPYRVVANPVVTGRNVDGTPREQAVGSREYTIGSFRIEPYMPAKGTALAQVLKKGHDLAEYACKGGSACDGIPYMQHAWTAGSGKASEADDAANLERGIDCSRSIWWAFTRSKIPYTSAGYLSTAQMFDADRGSCAPAQTPATTKMHENFESCLGGPFETGDVLVYQGVRPTDQTCVGHTILVVDPQEFIGWGSHGWDGSKDDAGKKLKDTGVEYQRILKGSWMSWDRRQFELKACWRHKQFISEAATSEPPLLGADWCDGPATCGK